MPSVTQERSTASPTTRDGEQPTADAPASTPFMWDDEETDGLTLQPWRFEMAIGNGWRR